MLEGGTYRPGDQLPPEPELAQRLDISRSTLREAMRTFEERGLITRRQGVGTFVNEPAPLIIDSGLEILESVDTLVRRRGITIQTWNLQMKEKPATPKLARWLEVGEDTVLTIPRRRISVGASRHRARRCAVVAGRDIVCQLRRGLQLLAQLLGAGVFQM